MSGLRDDVAASVCGKCGEPTRFLAFIPRFENKFSAGRIFQCGACGYVNWIAMPGEEGGNGAAGQK
jgi:hypothetical protein